MDMRISGTLNAYANYSVRRNNTPVTKGRNQSTTDSVSVSAQAHEFSVARKAIHELPDVRSAQVSQIQARLQSGTYSVSASDVAARIFSAAE
ncbi:MAG: flagellar biosynthesis anti-sigma factor FlgM [Defluviitaleaceae bacterium]|nr:flagellar biosynthesis anti-sigma factor FlgM [Defluviitaleaceae bacterium]MCL2239843.1 flagellar biosynthesis anti-sigma factor FlgM [Defluviitaleaceae bacterium]